MLPNRPIAPPEPPRVEFQLRWFLLLLSAVVLFALRNNRAALMAYSGIVVGGVALYVMWLPGQVRAAERRFTRDAMKLMATDDAAGLDSLANGQWVLRVFGPKHLLPDARGMAAAATGQHSKARAEFLNALKFAPPPLKPRIQLNLARAEMNMGLLDAAEGRYRAVLGRRGDMVAAQLGRLLVLKGTDHAEAVTHLRTGLQNADKSDLGTLNLALAEALKLSDQAGWESALEAAAAAGATDAEVARVTVLSSRKSTTRG